MSRENVEVVREMTEAFLRGDVEQALVAYDPDVEWDGRNLPDGKVARGLGAVVEHVARWAEQWEDWQYQPLDYIDAGDDVVLITRERGRSTAGVVMDERHAELYTVREGRIVRRVGFSDPNDALRQVGLRE
jgi:ketosteroid isomerase-like protein